MKRFNIVPVFLSCSLLLLGNVPPAISADVSINADLIGLETGDNATVVLQKITETQRSEISRQIIQGNDQITALTMNTQLDDGFYEISIDAPETYFRAPKGYSFKVFQNKIVNPGNKPINFRLDPPASQKFKPYRPTQNDTTISDIVPEPTPSSTWGRIPDMLEPVISLSAPIPKLPVEKSSSLQNTFRFFSLQGDGQYGYQPLSTGYHHFGVSTSAANTGIWGRFGVIDTGVRHDIDPYFEFIDDHIYECFGDNKWIEAGWLEASWLPDERVMFEMNGEDRTYNTYALPTGTTLEVSLQYVSGTTWEAKYYASGSWHLLEQKDVGFSTPSHTLNAGEVYTDMGIHPSFSFQSATTDLNKLIINGSWQNWDSSITTTIRSDTPYDAHVTTSYTNFYIHKHS